MSAPAIVGQRGAQPATANEIHSRQSAAQPDQARSAAPLIPVDAPAATGTARPDAATPLTSGAVATVGVVALAAVALFAVGLSRRRVAPALRTLLYELEDIRIPLALPVVGAEVLWDILAIRRATSSIPANSGHSPSRPAEG